MRVNTKDMTFARIAAIRELTKKTAAGDSLETGLALDRIAGAYQQALDRIAELENAPSAPAMRPFVERTLYVTLAVTLQEVPNPDDETDRADPEVVSDLTDEPETFARMFADHLASNDSEMWAGSGYWLRATNVDVMDTHWTGECVVIATPESDDGDDDDETDEELAAMENEEIEEIEEIDNHGNKRIEQR